MKLGTYYLKSTTLIIVFIFHLGKKRSDPNFIGEEKTDALKDCSEEPVIFEVREIPDDIKRENEEETEESTAIRAGDIPGETSNGDEDEDGDEDVDWEAFNKVESLTQFFKLPPLNPHFLQEYPEISETTHQGKYGCKDCSKSFHHKNDLVRHMNIHNGTKPYTCDTCGKTFLRSDYLRLHVIKHQGVKPLKCELCERRFYDRSNLRQHMRTHTGEKPAMCPYCPHRCSQLSDMRKHLTIHTKEKAFQCDTCGM